MLCVRRTLVPFCLDTILPIAPRLICFEEIIHHTIQAGYGREAWDVYASRIGGYKHLVGALVLLLGRREFAAPSRPTDRPIKCFASRIPTALVDEFLTRGPIPRSCWSP